MNASESQNDDSPTPEATTGEQPQAEPDRAAQPVDAEQPPRLAFPVVGLGASAGGLQAIGAFLEAMRPDAGLAYVLIQHLPPQHESHLPEILGRKTAMPVRQVEDGMPVEPDHVYVIRPGHVLSIEDGRLRLGAPLGSARAANRPIDDFFRSLAEEQRERAVCVILSGMGSNGTAGAQAIKAVGGLCIAQDPESAEFPSMPRHLIDAGYADYVARPAELPEILLNYAGSPYAKGVRESDADATLRTEQQHLREVLAVLRSRSRQDFAGYKPATLLRRVQRRMGLTKSDSLAEYARHLRHSQAEVTGLVDDLLIHVTGFFRDPEAWESLRKNVIVPLVESSKPGGVIRAWVAACSSGEEAYTLAILLLEAAHHAAKHLDIKVFATDLAERTLAHARNGLYAGGIESEISPERLARFFTRVDELYQVRQELRDRVVFAPQNVLRDPPFSRLDIACCRNLLIYLQPETQHRVLSLLHFGLREGGALFLGTSETVGGAEELFEPIDKKARIYRRLGSGRQGTIDIPVVRPASDAGGEAPVPEAPFGAPGRTAVAELAQRTILQSHTPAAVLVDRDHSVLYYHGDPRPYLDLAGQPTRDLLRLVRDGVRRSVRMALHQAATERRKVTVPDGWVDMDAGRRMRVQVTASPVVRHEADLDGGPEHYVVSFEERGEVVLPSPPGDDTADEGREVRRLRDELQSTIEELQTSNEELKASNEEVTSINEELQSANEELESGKEEMQSLNEELQTVNAQLRAKMEEHLTSSSDLSSLLTSTDIAVLFLDRNFRIRRYTPATRELIDLIATDVGRPLSALARKFDDAELDSDCYEVLDRLVPIEREVSSANGRHFIRRVHPYRTADNRIDGVVVTFLDVTVRKQIESALETTEEQFRRAVQDAPIPVIMQAEDGRVLQVSRTWTELTGYTLDELSTTGNWLTAAYGPVADAVRMHMHDLFTGTRKTLDVEFAIRTRDGQERHWSFSVSAPGRLRDGRRFLVGMAVDVSERRRAEDRLRRMLNIDVVGVLGFDSAGTLIETNDAFLRMSGYTREQVGAGVLNRRQMTPPEYHAESERQLETLAATGQIGPYEKEYFRSDGSRSWMLFAGAALGDGTVVEYVIDIGGKRRAEQALQISEERLRLAMTAARMGIWTLDLPSKVHTRDANLNRLLGLEPVDTDQPFSDFLDRVHPDDRQAVADAFARSEQEGRPLNVEFRVLRPDGTVIWLRDQGDVFRTSGDDRHMAGACVDVTERRTAELALRQSEERLRLIVTSATDYGIITLDADRVVTSWSPGAELIFQYAEDEILRRSADLLFTPEDRAAGAPAAEADQARREGRAADERWHLRKDGSRFFASGVLTPLGADAGSGFVKVLRDLTDRKQMEDELRRAHDELETRVQERTRQLAETNEKLRDEIRERERVQAVRAELVQRLTTAQEDERRRISRDLHDHTGQTLVGLRLALGALGKHSLPEEARDRLRSADELTNELGRQMHDLALQLRPVSLDDLGLEAALRSLVDQWSHRTGCQVEFASSGVEAQRLPPEVETVLYRVVQESLTNISRHAQATQVTLTLTCTPGTARLVIEDNGVGFEVEAVPPNRLGLLGMNERVTAVGGTLQIEATPGGPTTLFARIPLPTASAGKP